MFINSAPLSKADDRTENQNQRIKILWGSNCPKFSVEEWEGYFKDPYRTNERLAGTRPSLSHQLCHCQIIIWSPAILVTFLALSGIKRMERGETYPRSGKQSYCINNYWPVGQLSLHWEGLSVCSRTFLWHAGSYPT